MQAQAIKKIDNLKSSLEKYNRMLLLFKYHIDIVSKMPNTLVAKQDEEAKTSERSRTTFTDSTKVQV